MQTYRSNPPSRMVKPRPANFNDPSTLLREISRACRKHGLGESTFGRRAVNDPAFVRRLRSNDTSASMSTAERVRGFIKQMEASNG